MNFKYIIVLSFFISINVLAQSGIKAGINISNYYGVNANYGGIKHESFVAPFVGYFKDWDIAKDSSRKYYFSIGLETDLSVKGAIIRNKVVYSEINPPEIWDISDREMYGYYLELPHTIKLHYMFTKNIHAQLYGGGILSFDIVDVTRSIRDSNPEYSYNIIDIPFYPVTLGDMPAFLSYNLLAGATFTYKRFLLDIRYSKGVTEIYQGIYLSATSISLGYSL